MLDQAKQELKANRAKMKTQLAAKAASLKKGKGAKKAKVQQYSLCQMIKTRLIEWSDLTRLEKVIFLFSQDGISVVCFIFHGSKRNKNSILCDITQIDVLHVW